MTGTQTNTAPEIVHGTLRGSKRIAMVRLNNKLVTYRPGRTYAQFATVAEDFEYTDNTLATASWWDKYTVLAGKYPIRYDFSFENYVTLDDGGKHCLPTVDNLYYPLFADITTRAVLHETYRVNRVFTASSAHHVDNIEKEQDHVFRLHAYLAVLEDSGAHGHFIFE